jgi:hypothetical protein
VPNLGLAAMQELHPPSVAVADQVALMRFLHPNDALERVRCRN